MELNPNSAGARLLASAAITGLAGCGIFMNAHFGWHLGTTTETKVVFTALSVCFDIAKIVCLPLVFWHLSKGARLNAFAAGMIWLTAVVYGMTSAFGFAAAERSTIQAEQQIRNERIAEAKAKVARLEANIEKAKLAKNSKGGFIFENSGSCLNPTKEDSKKFCSEYFAALNDLDRARDAVKAAGEVREADPQIATFARLTGLGRDTIGNAMAIGIAIVLELVTSLSGMAFAKTRAPTSEEARAKARATREAKKKKAEKMAKERRKAARRRAQARQGGLVAIQGGKR
ncbi:MAG: hypothetical protein E6Q97_31245 [Desulfurellales bacterium]|nr:MAG: hypothetical protein E6Q97_31245 [Desulfurellales bacterium]